MGVVSTAELSLKGHNRQHSGQMSQNIQNRKNNSNTTGQLRYVVKYKVRKMAKSHHCYYPMLLMRTTKTAVFFTNIGHFSSPLCVLTGFLAKFHE